MFQYLYGISRFYAVKAITGLKNAMQNRKPKAVVPAPASRGRISVQSIKLHEDQESSEQNKNIDPAGIPKYVNQLERTMK